MSGESKKVKDMISAKSFNKSRLLSRIADACVSPPSTAVYIALVFFVWSVLGLTQVSYFGHTSQEAKDFAIQHFTRKVIFFQFRILAMYLAIALFGGVLAWGLIAARDWVGARKPPPRWVRFFRSVFIVGALHLYFFSRAVVETPEVYAQVLYFKGGWRRWVQTTLTHELGLWGVDLIFFLFVTVFVFSPFLRRGVRRNWGRGAVRLWKNAKALREGRSKFTKYAPLIAVLPLVFLALGIGLVSFKLSPLDRSPENKGLNIVILAVDGLRFDAVRRVSPDGRKWAPNMSRFSQNSANFTRAYTSLARTFPSWISLLTGRFPHSHGIRHMFPSPEELASIGESLPEHLSELGYSTAVVSDYAGEIFGRVDLGFERIEVPRFDFYEIVKQQSLRVHTHLLPYLINSLGRRLFPVVDGFPDSADPYDVGRRVRKRLRELSRKEKFFLTAFISTTHFPYAAPYPFYRMFTNPSYRGSFKYGKTRIPGERKPSVSDIRQVRGLYAGAVASVDIAVGMVLDELHRLGIADRTVVVITADHGETLYEGDLGMGHGDHLRGETALRIPFMIRVPDGLKARDISAVVRDIDLAPTLAALAGEPLKHAEGLDLRPLIEGKVDDLDLAAFSETGLWFTLQGEGWTPEDRLFYPEVLGGLMEVDPKHGFTIKLKDDYEKLIVAAKHRCIMYKNWKLIYRPLQTGVDLKMYDIETDPQNEQDLSDKQPDIKAKLWRRLKGWMLQEPNSVSRGEYVLPRHEQDVGLRRSN